VLKSSATKDLRMDSTKLSKRHCSFNPVHILHTGPRLCELKAYPSPILCVLSIGSLQHLTQFCTLPIATAVSCASPVTSFTFTPDCRRVCILSRTNGRGGSQIPTKPTYTKSCRDDPRAIPTTEAKIKPAVYCSTYCFQPSPFRRYMHLHATSHHHSVGTCTCKWSLHATRQHIIQTPATTFSMLNICRACGCMGPKGCLPFRLSQFSVKSVSNLHCQLWTTCRYSPKIYFWHYVRKWLKLVLTFRLFLATKLPYEKCVTFTYLHYSRLMAYTLHLNTNTYCYQ
jgi:hypothetical protein